VRTSEVVGGDDAAEAAWFPVDELPPLAFDHQKIFDAAKERLRQDIHFKPVGFDMLDDTFTIPDLQRVYEAILGSEFDRRNFHRKIMASGILDEVGSGPREKGQLGRLANHYSLNRDLYGALKKEGGKKEF
jgi:8-oxo-dGTP diphosphatase